MKDLSPLDQMLQGLLNMGLPFYDCMIMKDGACVYRRMGGSMEGRAPVGKELYDIYSCSKLITCTAALQLWEKGLFRLDDPLSDYMPEFAHMRVAAGEETVPAVRPITIRQLFTMTAGFSYNLASPMIQRCRQETEGACPTVTLVQCLAKEPLLFQPGERWEYSLCHDVLAALVEVLSGRSFGSYVKEHIFAVAGMTHSTFLPSEQEKEAICPLYRYNEQTGKIELCPKNNTYRLGYAYESGGAGCTSTVEDYVAFLEALRTDRLLQHETVDLLATNQLTDAQRAMPSYWVSGKRGYGLGQQCPAWDNTRPDFGWGGAAGAHYFVDRQNGLVAYLGTHVLGFSAFQEARVALTPLAQSLFS